MASKLFEVGDLVWAKMKYFAPWPAQIAEPPKDCKTPSVPKKEYVFFFGTENYGWISRSDITPHSRKMVEAANLKKKSQQLQSAIDEILLLSKKEQKKRKDQDPEADVKAMPSRKRQKEMKNFEEHIDEVHSESEESICSGEHVEDENDKLSKINSGLQPRVLLVKLSPTAGTSSQNVQINPRAEVEYYNHMVSEEILLPHDSYSNFIKKYKSKDYVDSGNNAWPLHGHSVKNPQAIISTPPQAVGLRDPSYIKKPTLTLDILTECRV